ncbi:MAG: hypothetical protein ABFD79_14355 [Phycisphaerales bacterium]
MLIGKKYNLLLILSVVFALLMLSYADAARSGGSGGRSGGGHSRGSHSSSSGISGSHRSGGDFRGGSGGHDSSHSRRGSFDSRSRDHSPSGLFDGRGGGDHQRNDFDRRRQNDFRKDYDRSRVYRRPYSGNISSHTWQFSGDYTRYPHPYSNRNLSTYNNNYRRYSNPYSRYDNRYGYRYHWPYNNYYNYNRFGDNNRYYRYNRYGYDRYNPYYYPRYYNRGFYPYSGLGFGYWPYLYGGYYSDYYNGYSSYDNYGGTYYDDNTYNSYSDSKPIYRSHIPRRYIFVSLNGYWPGYNYLRYYNYGTYPYFWYMTADSPYQTGSNPYPATGNSYSNDNPYTYKEGNANYEPFANITEPAKQTSTDQYFQKGVELFAAGNYSRASDYFYQAKGNARSDVILPFAYIQSLFAEGKYPEAARNLRDTMDRQPAGSDWAFYPRGLYLDEKVLLSQIDKLVSQAGSNSELQLLAGYQLMGVGRYDEALDFLNKAQASDKNNQTAAGKLIFVLNNLKANYQTQNAQ